MLDSYLKPIKITSLMFHVAHFYPVPHVTLLRNHLTQDNIRDILHRSELFTENDPYSSNIYLPV